MSEDTSGSVLTGCGERMAKTVEALKEEFASLRGVQANPKQFQGVSVVYYDTPTPLGQLAAIQAVDARTILVSPYDATSLPAVEKALRQVPGSGNPIVDENTVKIIFPELNEERRREFVKQIRAKAEDSRIALRNLRRKAKSELEALEAGKDGVARAEKDLEALTKKYVAEIDTILKRKEAELLQL